MTQRELADEVGLTESAIRNYERGIRTPGDQQIGRIAEALDVSADSICFSQQLNLGFHD